MKKRLFTLSLFFVVSCFAFSQKKDNTKINLEDFEKLQVELQKQAEVQKHFYLEIDSLNEKIAILSRENIVLQEKLSIIKSDLEKLTSESINSDNELSQKVDKAITEFSKECSNLKDGISTIKTEVQNSITELQCEFSTKLENQYSDIESKQKADKDILNNELNITNIRVDNTQDKLSSQGSIGALVAIALLVIIAVLTFFSNKKIKKGNNGINEIKKAQDALEKAHIAMQEESIKLDNKLLEMSEKHLVVTHMENKEVDHSLALKVADEIVRIETNLLRMDANVKGYKQLSKAVERIKNNFYANGYEIVEMLGKKYTQGMKAAVTFISDETLKEGEQIITKIIKPQINYKNEMIQAAQIEVSQAE